MVKIIKRMRKLKTLLALRLGPGAAILPPEVTRVHMEFAVKQNQGHGGARVFWRTCLRRLKYYNPAVPMTVSHPNRKAGPALLTIHFTDPSAASDSKPAISSTTTTQTSNGPVTASNPSAPTERIEVVNMKRRSESQILARVMELTKAKEVPAMEEDLAQLRELKEFREMAEADAKRQNALLEKMQREKDIMDRARAMVDV